MVTDNLQLAMIGNSTVAALLDEKAEIVWTCLPGVDGDPVFCSLLRERVGEEGLGFFALDLIDLMRCEQEYLSHTAIVVTRLHDRRGSAVEIVDFAPRYAQFGRTFAPMILVRRVRPLAGSPRVCVRMRPATDYGASRPGLTYGSNHLRYVGSSFTLRLTTDCSIAAIVEEVPFVLQGEVAFLIGPDEALPGAVPEVTRRLLEQTTDYWHKWVPVKIFLFSDVRKFNYARRAVYSAFI